VEKRRKMIHLKNGYAFEHAYGVVGYRNHTHLRRYASISLPSMTLRTLHWTISSISSQTSRFTSRNPPRLMSRSGSRAGMSCGDGANHISSSFSAPSKGAESICAVSDAKMMSSLGGSGAVACGAISETGGEARRNFGQVQIIFERSRSANKWFR
jgi:hypothetical protein